MNQFHPQMTSEQIYDTLKEYNETLLDIAVNGTIDEFNQAIEEWNIESVNKTPEYVKAIRAYRMNQPVMTMNGVMFNYPIQKLSKAKNSIFSQSPLYDIFISYQEKLDIMALEILDSDTYDPKEQAKKNRAITDENNKKKIMREYFKSVNDFINYDLINDFPNKYRHGDTSNFYNDFVDIIVEKFVKQRENFYMVFNLEFLDDTYRKLHKGIFSEDSRISNFNNDLSRVSDPKQQLKILQDTENEIYRLMREHNQTVTDIGSYFKFAPKPQSDTSSSRTSHKVSLRNYLAGKNINPDVYNKFRNGKHVKNRLFYYELAFFLGLPTSEIIRKFFSFLGVGINSIEALVTTNDYNFFEDEILHWIDCGVDTNILNTMFNFAFERKYQ